MTFFLKKLLSRFLFPVPLCAGLLVSGLVLLRFTKWKKTGRGLVITGTLLLFVFGYPWLPRFALSRLESQSRPLMEVSGQRPEVRGPKLSVSSSAATFIFVLGGSALSADTNRAPNARFGDISMKRVVEGVRLRRLMTNSTLLVSVPGPAVSAGDKGRVMGELLHVFGLPPDDVQICATARDTEDEIRWCKPIAGTNPVYLVTCALHLPRAMFLARRHGLAAIPAPSGYVVDEVTQSPFGPNKLFPGAVNFYNTERGLNEYLGLVWEGFSAKGQPSAVREQ